MPETPNPEPKNVDQDQGGETDQPTNDQSNDVAPGTVFVHPLDYAIALLVLVFAFLASAFAIQNSVFWLHLATGRYLSENIFNVGVDPFSWGTEGVLWVNHNWLHDLFSYALFSAIGGMGLVILKALLIAFMGWILLRTAAKPSSLLMASVITLVALIAASPRLFFLPGTFSLILLAVLLYAVVNQVFQKGIGVIVAMGLTILWVNYDDWFVLAPVVIICHAIGVFLAKSSSRGETEGIPDASRLRFAWVSAIASVLACLVSPFFLSGLTLPAELGLLAVRYVPIFPDSVVAAGKTIQIVEQYDPTFVSQYASWGTPWTASIFYRPNLGINLAGIAYVVICFLGFGTFVGIYANGRRASVSYPIDGFAVLWLFGFLISASMSRLVPIFVVFSVPLIIRNLECLWEPDGKEVSQAVHKFKAQMVMIGRLALFAFLVALILFTYPGWWRGQFGSGTSPYRVAFDLKRFESQANAGEKLAELKEENLIERGWNYNADAACVAAWETPTVKNCYDTRYGLFLHQAEFIGKMRFLFRMPMGRPNPETIQRYNDYGKLQREQFAKHEVTHLLFSNIGVSQETPVFWRVQDLLRQPKDFTLAYADGETAIFRWWGERMPNDAETDTVRFDFNTAAFSKEQRPVDTQTIRFPSPNDPWVNFFIPVSSDREALARSKFFLASTEVVRDVEREYFSRLFGASPRSLWRITRFDSSLPALLGNLFTELNSRPNQMFPPGLAYLPVQSAREAVAENPNSGDGYLILATAYDILWHQNEDFLTRIPSEQISPLRNQVRQNQITTSWRMLSQVYPDNLEARWRLSEIYLKAGYYDLALEQYSAVMELASNIGDPRVIQQRLGVEVKELQSKYEFLQKIVQGAQEQFKIQAVKMNLPQKVDFAIRGNFDLKMPDNNGSQRVKMGLAAKALQLINESESVNLPENERMGLFILQLSLLTETGQMDKVYPLIQTPLAENLPPDFRAQVTLQLGASMGMTEIADSSLAFLEEKLQKMGPDQVFGNFLIAQLSQKQLQNPGLPALESPLTSTLNAYRFIQMRFNREYRAQSMLMHTLRGLLWLESKNIAKAEERFRHVVENAPSDIIIPDVDLARVYLDLIESANRKE